MSDAGRVVNPGLEGTTAGVAPGANPLEVRGAATLAEVDAGYDLAARVFGPDYFTATATFAQARRLEPLHELGDLVVAVAGGSIVGAVRILDRTVRVGARSLRVGGITMVCAHPAVRGSGVGRALMNVALERSRARGDALSIAFARRAVDGFYPRLGYLGIGCHPEMRVQPAGKDEGDGAATPGFRHAAAPAYAAAYEASYGRLPFGFVRDEAWWQTTPARFAPWAGPDSFMTVVAPSGTVAGYFVVLHGRVIEAAACAGDEVHLASAITRHLRARGSELVLALAPGHWLVGAWRGLNHTLTVRQAWDGGHVVRAVDAPAVRRALADVLPGAHLARLDALGVDRHDDALAFMRVVAGLDLPPSAPTACAPAWSRVDEF